MVASRYDIGGLVDAAVHHISFDIHLWLQNAPTTFVGFRIRILLYNCLGNDVVG
jgi:hypothetical protein